VIIVVVETELYEVEIKTKKLDNTNYLIKTILLPLT